MISKELALDFAKELYGSACKLTPCVYKYEGSINSQGIVDLINNRTGKFILVKISSTFVTKINAAIYTPKSRLGVGASTISEINDCDELFLPVRSLQIINYNDYQLEFSIYAYGYAVE